MAETPTRKLAVLLHADVVGSTNLVRLDETLAHQRIQDAFKRFRLTITEYNGIAHEIRGDALVAEFARASDALSAALAFQAANAAYAEALPDDIRPSLRVGVAMGEVVVADNTVTGEGVVLAQRLEQLAEPGGVCVQGAVYETAPKRLPFEYQGLGRKRLKGFQEAIRVYSVALRAGQAVPGPEAGSPQGAPPSGSRGKPSIAVLPFVNMSGDPDQEHFCDGITEDIITALSRTRWFGVISRSSSFAYKGASPDVRRVARELGVGYVLEGSLRKGGERVRITAQLIDAATGNHVWAERYSYQHVDEFAIQDEIAHRVASILNERIWQDMAGNIERKPPGAFGPYEYAFLGVKLLHHLEPDDVTEAKRYLNKALALDDDLATAHLGLGFCYLMDFGFWGDPSGRALDQADYHAKRMEYLAPDDAQTFRLRSRVYGCRRMFDEAFRCADRALRINPDDGDIIANKGITLLYCGQPDEAVEWLDRVLAMHSDTPHTADIVLFWKSVALFMLTDYPGAVAALRAVSGLGFLKSLLLAACHARRGSDKEAGKMVESVLQTRPGLRVSDIGMWRNFRREADQAHLRDALVQAGLPK